MGRLDEYPEIELASDDLIVVLDASNGNAVSLTPASAVGGNPLTVVKVITEDYTLLPEDDGAIILVDPSEPSLTITLPDDLLVTNIGFKVDLVRASTNEVYVHGGPATPTFSSVFHIDYEIGFKLRAYWSVCTLLNTGAWLVAGDIARNLSQFAVYDSFTRANQPFSLDNAETGQEWIVALLEDSIFEYGISSNAAYHSDEQYVPALIDAGISDGTISATFLLDEEIVSSNQVTFRGDGSNDNYMAIAWEPPSMIKLIKKVDGEYTDLIFGTATPELGTEVNIKVVLDGSSIIVLVDDVEDINTTDSTNLSNTYHGFLLQHPTDRVDEFWVAP